MYDHDVIVLNLGPDLLVLSQGFWGNNEGILRVNNVRYPRQLIRIKQGDVLDGIAAKMLTKYRGVATPVSPEAIAAERTRIEDGIVWVFELVPR